MTLQLHFETDNAAFEDPAEAGRILREVAVQIDAGMVSGEIRDTNGNRIGHFRFGMSIQSDIVKVLEYYADSSKYSISDFLPIGCDEGEAARDMLKRIDYESDQRPDIEDFTGITHDGKMQYREA